MDGEDLLIKMMKDWQMKLGCREPKQLLKKNFVKWIPICLKTEGFFSFLSIIGKSKIIIDGILVKRVREFQLENKLDSKEIKKSGEKLNKKLYGNEKIHEVGLKIILQIMKRINYLILAKC